METKQVRKFADAKNAAASTETTAKECTAALRNLKATPWNNLPPDYQNQFILDMITARNMIKAAMTHLNQ